MCFHRARANCRMEAVTADMPLCQRRRRTWQFSEGEGWATTHSSIIRPQHCSSCVLIMPAPYPLSNLIALSPCLCLCLCFSLFPCRHVMNELLETERAYVEELLCVLQVFTHPTIPQAIAKLIFLSLLPMPLIPCAVIVCFRDMLLRWIIQRWLISSLLLCRTKRRCCLATCQRSTTSTRGEWAPSGCYL